MGRRGRRPKKRQWGFRQEFHRKIIHLGSILFLAVYAYFLGHYSHEIALLVLSALLIIMLELEYFRVEWKWSVPIVSFLWKYRRDHEHNRLGADVFFLMGSIICLAVFDVRIAAAAILMATFGDFAAAIFGKAFGKTWVRKGRAMEGILPEFLVNIVVGFFIVRTLVDGQVWWLTTGMGVSGAPIWPVILVMAAVATFVETLVDQLDDNLLIPVFAGFFGQLTLFLVTGVLSKII